MDLKKVSAQALSMGQPAQLMLWKLPAAKAVRLIANTER
jgi:hypothetical protein